MSSLDLFAPVVAILGLAYSLVFWNHVQRADSGTPAMQKVAAAILQGANAFVKRQYRTIAILTIVTAVGMTVVYGLTGGEEGWVKGFEVGGSFLLGAVLSAVSGIVSMIVATRANLKTASAPKQGSRKMTPGPRPSLPTSSVITSVTARVAEQICLNRSPQKTSEPWCSVSHSSRCSESKEFCFH